MARKSKTTLKKIFLNITAAGLAVFVTATTIATENSVAVNSALGVKTYEIVNDNHEDTSEFIRYYESEYENIAELKAAGYDIVRRVEEEGAVLLKNDNDVLPMKDTKLSLFGAASTDPLYGGTGSAGIESDDVPDYKTALENVGFTINNELYDWYSNSGYGRTIGEGNTVTGFPISIGEAPWSEIEKNCGSGLGTGEAALFIIGRNAGEGGDHEVANQSDGLNGDYLTLNTEELSILKGLKELKDEGRFSAIVVLINSPNPLSCAFINDDEYGVDAALWIGAVGQTGLYAVADLLKGNATPSGKLSDTFWMDNRLNPAIANFGSYVYENADQYTFADPERFINYVVYQEGVYVGYRYTETRYEDKILGTPNTGDYQYEEVVAYPFGYGLSYTNFEYSDFTVEKGGQGRETTYEATVTVTNIGEAEGKEAVEIYLQKPYTSYDVENQIEKPSVELVGYAKTDTLKPGEYQKLTISIPEYYFTSFDAYGAGTYILSEGTHYLTVAENAHNAVNNILAKKGKTMADGMTAEGNAQMVFDIDYAFDTETYRMAMGTGNEVTARFDFVDMNRYEGRGENTITYCSRNDWEGTLSLWKDEDGDKVSDDYVRLAMTDQIAKDLVLDDDDIPADPEGMEFPTMGSTNTALQLIDLRVDENGNEIPFEDPLWDSLLDQLTYDQLTKIVSIGMRMTVGIEEIGKPETLDHNGSTGVTQAYGNGQNGYATITDDPDKSLTGTQFPCNGIMAATWNDLLIKEAGELFGEDAMWAGYSGIYGTGLNIHRTPYGGRVFEYYSEDPILSGLMVASETAGIQSKGVYVYNKHFVMNDQENNRRGIGTWATEQAMREIYLRAFELPILYADAKCVMTSFNRLGAFWSGGSYALITEWLRGEAGMSGFAVTDMQGKYAVTYMSVPHEVLAGNDLPDGYPGRVETGADLSDVTEDILLSEFVPYAPGGKKESATMAWAMRESAHRVLYTVVHSRGMDGIASGSRIVTVTPWWQTALNAVTAVFGGLTIVAVLLMVFDMIQRKKRIEVE
ncbi:MAG: glycoside hydrolase family 3 C-terminal domain-containing protein [Clostridiales bacterium]|nr:glycoside hydrolase family 3 C-terminal domain-containing protein [Clostridiales bacterium]